MLKYLIIFLRKTNHYIFTFNIFFFLIICCNIEGFFILDLLIEEYSSKLKFISE